MNYNKVFTVVVTFNRKILLKECINSILKQSVHPEKIIIVDNASTDGSKQLLEDEGLLDTSLVDYLFLTENSGGSGGFAVGIDYAVKQGADWVWIMDDDAFPEPDALEKLLCHATDKQNIYGSVAVEEHGQLSWRLSGNKKNENLRRNFYSLKDLPAITSVQFLPFLGLLISKQIIKRIGLPDKEFFLAADDVDFCFRARSMGAKIYAVRASRLRHPAAELYSLQLPWRKLWCLRLPPWKRYYDVRNRLFVARNHYGMALYYQTIPGSLLRFIGTMFYEKQRVMQTKAFVAGMMDGLTNKKGRRHEQWGL